MDFLVQENRQIFQVIVSMTYYTKDYINILERLKINNTDIRCVCMMLVLVLILLVRAGLRMSTTL